MADQCHTSDLNEDEIDVNEDADDVAYADYGADDDDYGADDDDVDNDDVRLVGRRPGDVASCFASAGKVLLPSLAFPCNIFVHESILMDFLL